MAARWVSTTGILALALATAPTAAQEKITVPGAPEINMILIPVPAGADVEAALPKVIQQVGAAQGGIAQHAKPSQVSVGGTPLRIESVAFNKAPGTAFFFLSTPQGRGICMAAVPLARIKQVAQATGTACLAALGSGGAGGAAPPTATTGTTRKAAPAPASPLPPSAPGAHAGNWAKVSDVYFRNLPSFGVGGMMIMKFIPVILFKDGSYYEIGDDPLEDVDLAASRAAKPNDWGRWSRQGNRFILTGSKGKPHDYELQQGNFFKAFPASGTASLVGSYTSLSGGGNTAFGGEVMIASQSRYTFLPGGGFSTERSTGAMNNGSMSGVGSTVASNRKGQGRFTVDRYTLTIERPDGRRERRFFAFGSEKSPARMDKDMLFIGDSVYTLDD